VVVWRRARRWTDEYYGNGGKQNRGNKKAQKRYSYLLACKDGGFSSSTDSYGMMDHHYLFAPAIKATPIYSYRK